MVKSIEWCTDSVRFIDQTKLPSEEIYVKTSEYAVLAEAIRSLKIRGAPLIGIAAAYGVALASLRSSRTDFESLADEVSGAINLLGLARPTAINLFWALDRMKSRLNASTSVPEVKNNLVNEAVKIHREDEEMCRRIGENGAGIVPQQAGILTHCNTGALATGGSGTAQSVITTAHRQGKSIEVYADETRPLFQGARLTTWELMKSGVNVILITDGTAASVMRQKKIDLVITGADRIAANGDTANKIGTYGVAVLAKHHKIPFYIAAPTSTVDPSVADGDKIPIENRHFSEVTTAFGICTAPEGVSVYSPAFDMTPSSLITAIITDRGIYYPPFHFT